MIDFSATGGTQEAPRRHPGGTQEAPDRHPGSTQEAPRRKNVPKHFLSSFYQKWRDQPFRLKGAKVGITFYRACAKSCPTLDGGIPSSTTGPFTRPSEPLQSENCLGNNELRTGPKNPKPRLKRLGKDTATVGARRTPTTGRTTDDGRTTDAHSRPAV